MSHLGLDTPQSCSLYTNDLWVSVNRRLPQKAVSLMFERCTYLDLDPFCLQCWG